MGRLVRRSFLFALCAVALAGCGFQPLLGRAGDSADAIEQLSAIRIEPIPDRSGQVLRNALLDRITPQGQTQASRYVLRIRLSEPRQTILLRRDDIISRSSYTANATFELRDMQGRRVFSGSSSFITDYEITASEFATRTSLENARDRVLELVADDIRNQLALDFRQRQNAAR
ncbi:MAG: LPS assembly lipoprotein LptE [Magnetospirillum sp.]|nr:LPS assembly lipoprotein LptE [Magnetospirillum sp.]